MQMPDASGGRSWALGLASEVLGSRRLRFLRGNFVPKHGFSAKFC